MIRLSRLLVQPCVSRWCVRSLLPMIVLIVEPILRYIKMFWLYVVGLIFMLVNSHRLCPMLTTRVTNLKILTEIMALSIDLGRFDTPIIG